MFQFVILLLILIYQITFLGYSVKCSTDNKRKIFNSRFFLFFVPICFTLVGLKIRNITYTSVWSVISLGLATMDAFAFDDC